MTPDGVLQIFRDWQQFAMTFDDGETIVYVPLTFESTLSEWSAVCQLELSKQTGRYLNRMFSIGASEEQWHSVLLPNNRLRALCSFISSYTESRTALVIDGALMPRMFVTHERMFKTLCRRLNGRGVPLDAPRPSTPLESYMMQHFEAIVDTVNELAPGAFPPPDFRWKEANPISICIAFTSIYCMFQLFYRYSASVLGSLMGTGIICFFVVKCWDKYHVQRHFRDVETLGDLTRLLVMHRNRIDAAISESTEPQTYSVPGNNSEMF